MGAETFNLIPRLRNVIRFLVLFEEGRLRDDQRKPAAEAVLAVARDLVRWAEELHPDAD